MKIKSLKPKHEDVFLDDSPTPTHRLTTVSEASYCDWQDAMTSQVVWADDDGQRKFYRYLGIYKSSRALLIGYNLYPYLPAENGGKPKVSLDPVGEQWVRDSLEPASITEMYDWLIDNSGIRIVKTPEPVTDPPPADKGQSPPADAKQASKGPESVWEVEQREAAAKTKAEAAAPTTEGELKN